MPERQITLTECAQAHSILTDIDPDDCQNGTLESVVWNRKELEPHSTNHQRRLQQIVRPHLVTDEDGEIQEIEEGEQVTPLEASLGVRLEFDDPGKRQEVANKINGMGDEKVTVNVATEPYKHLDQITDRVDDLRFMLDVDV